MSKGSARRPRAIDSTTEAEHWDNTFRPLRTTAQQAEGMTMGERERIVRDMKLRGLLGPEAQIEAETAEAILNRSLRDMQERGCL